MAYPDKILWIGTYATGTYLTDLMQDKIYVQTAANRVQGYYLNELADQTGKTIDVLSALVSVAYPNSNARKINEDLTEIPGKMKIVNVSFANYPYLNILSQSKNIKKKARVWAKENRDKNVCVVVYSLRLPLLEAAYEVKKIIPNATIVNIVPDLPQYMHQNESVLHKAVRAPYQKAINRISSIIDGYILYTHSMANALNITDIPHIVIEGLFSQDIILGESFLKPNNEKKIVMYAGILSAEYGTKLIVDAFINASIPNAELHIYGHGEYLEELKIVSSKYPCIKYMGFVTPEKAYEAMCAADLLVNARPSAPEFTKYSFPSKVFEYLASGTPVLMTRLPGIGNEYFDYVYTIDDESIEGISQDLRRILLYSDDERHEKGKKAQMFLLNNKSSKKQIEKLLTFIEKIKDDGRTNI